MYMQILGPVDGSETAMVVGTHGRRGVERMLLGSGAEQIIWLAPAPVLVIRSGAQSSVSHAMSAGRPHGTGE